MDQKDIIRMNLKELKRLKVIQEVISKHITQKTAAEILVLSKRQIGRIFKRVSLEGDRGIVHKARGKPSHRKITDKLKAKVIALYKKKYPDFGPTLAVEKLSEIDKINLSKETLRKWLVKEGLWARRRKSRPHRHWRPRRECFGQMVQMDGSHHDWLESRGPKLVFICYIDDARNEVFGRFYDYEGTFPAMDSFTRYIKRYGIPQSIYLDKHTTYKSTRKQTLEEELENKQAMSQFERALDELSVEVIHANSPQAKGRVERSFRTHQDRLIKEMRLKSISSAKEANRFLDCYYIPKHNRKFSIPAQNKTNLHRPLPDNLDLDKILCIKQEASLRNDFTVAYAKKLYQVLEPTVAKKVIVEERINGAMLITYKGKPLKYKQIDKRPLKIKPEKRYASKLRKVYIPPKDHPYKSFKISPYTNYLQKEKLAQKEKELQLVH